MLPLHKPHLWIVLWAAYTLLAFGWLAYREALAGFFCGSL